MTGDAAKSWKRMEKKAAITTKMMHVWKDTMQTIQSDAKVSEIVDGLKTIHAPEPRFKSNAATLVFAVIMISLLCVPNKMTRGQVWHDVLQGACFCGTLVSLVGWFYRNTSMKAFKFLAMQSKVIYLIGFSLLTWSMHALFPRTGYETSGPLKATTELAFRLAFLGMDALIAPNSAFIPEVALVFPVISKTKTMAKSNHLSNLIVT